MSRIFIALLLILSSARLQASGSPPQDAAKKAGDHAGGEKATEDAKPTNIGPKRDYNPGKVIPFPEFAGDLAGQKGAYSRKVEKGRAAMIIFVSSWCEPCQVLMIELKQLARKYANTSTDIVFVFAHDTKEDAAGFIKEYQIPHTAVMANPEILTKFKNPELPSIYLGDRWGYIADRFIKIKKSDIDKIDQSMSRITAL